MGRRGLCDMYTQVQGHAVSEGKCKHIRQIRSCMLFNTSDTYNLLNLPFHVMPHYITTDTVSDHGICILIFL